MKVLLGNKWNDFCLDTLCFFCCLPNTFCAEFFNLSEVAQIFVINWGKSFWLTLFLRCSFVFLSCPTADPADWGAVFDLENSSWLLLDGKLGVILFIVGYLVCWSLRCETDTETGFLVIVLVGKPLKAKGSGDIISVELKLIFCSCSMVSLSVFLLILLEKSYPSSFALLTSFQLFLYVHVFV